MAALPTTTSTHSPPYDGNVWGAFKQSAPTYFLLFFRCGETQWWNCRLPRLPLRPGAGQAHIADLRLPGLQRAHPGRKFKFRNLNIFIFVGNSYLNFFKLFFHCFVWETGRPRLLPRGAYGERRLWVRHLRSPDDEQSIIIIVRRRRRRTIKGNWGKRGRKGARSECGNEAN